MPPKKKAALTTDIVPQYSIPTPKTCKWCDRERDSIDPLTGLKVEWRDAHGKQCRSCPRKISKSIELQARAKTGALLEDLKDVDFKTAWLTNIADDDQKQNDKKDKHAGPRNKVRAEAFNEGRCEQVKAICWPCDTFEAEAGRKLEEHEIKKCTKYGKEFKGCWRTKGSDSLAIGAITFKDALGENTTDEMTLADSKHDGDEYTRAIAKAVKGTPLHKGLVLKDTDTLATKAKVSTFDTSIDDSCILILAWPLLPTAYKYVTYPWS